MSARPRPDSLPGSKSLALVFAVAILASSASHVAWPKEEVPATAPGSVVVIPFVLDGRIDQELTTAFVDHLASSKATWQLVDGSAVAQKLPKGAKLSSTAPVESLLKAARAAGAEAVILGQASRYKVLDAPGISLKVRLLASEGGDELQKKVTEASGWTARRAKREVAKTASKKLLKEFGIK